MYQVGILTMSDKGSRGEREDLSKKVIEEIVIEHGYKVVVYRLIPDDFERIKKELIDAGGNQSRNDSRCARY